MIYQIIILIITCILFSLSILSMAGLPIGSQVLINNTDILPESEDDLKKLEYFSIGQAGLFVICSISICCACSIIFGSYKTSIGKFI